MYEFDLTNSYLKEDGTLIDEVVPSKVGNRHPDLKKLGYSVSDRIVLRLRPTAVKTLSD